jgi:hypothetical protein
MIICLCWQNICLFYSDNNGNWAFTILLSRWYEAINFLKWRKTLTLLDDLAKNLMRIHDIIFNKNDKIQKIFILAFDSCLWNFFCSFVLKKQASEWELLKSEFASILRSEIIKLMNLIRIQWNNRRKGRAIFVAEKTSF